jgi:hypothetical protein
LCCACFVSKSPAFGGNQMLLECQQNKHLAQTFSGFCCSGAKWQQKIREKPQASKGISGKQLDSREEMT